MELQPELQIPHLISKQERWSLINDPLADDPVAALKRDRELLQEVAAGTRSATARIWENPQCLVVTRRETRFPQFTAACEQLKSEAWPVLVRESGGTCVPHQPGIIHFTLLYPQSSVRSPSLDDTYIALCEPIRRAIASFGIEAHYGETEGSYCDGDFNLNINGLKVTGTAQRIVGAPKNEYGIKSAVMAQAMIVVDADAVAGTDWVNRFYKLAGNERRFKPEVATSVKAQLDGTDRILQQSGITDFTLLFRQRLAEAFVELAQQD